MKHYNGKKDEDSLKKIVALTGLHTLTVELLAKTARNGDLEIKELLQKLTEVGFNLNEVVPETVTTDWHEGKENKRFFEHLEKVFELSDLGADEQFILANLSVLPAVFIERKKLADWLKLESKDALNLLRDKGWLQEQDAKVFMHQVIQEVTRHRLKPTFETCAHLVKSLILELNIKPSANPLGKAEYVPFAEAILLNFPDKNQDMASLSNNLSAINLYLGRLEQALKFQLKSVEIRKEIFDPKHLDLANSYNNLSLIYRDLGQLEQGLEFQLKAIEIREEILDPKHPNLAGSYNNISMIYQPLGQLDHALKFQLKAIEIHKKIHDPKHPALATSYNNLSMIYNDLYQLDQALEFQLKAIEIREEIHDPKHPDLAQSYNNLSVIYRNSGQLVQALKFQLKAIEIREETLDPKHWHLAQAYSNLAAIYFDQKKVQNAHQICKKAVEIYQFNFPHGHPELDNALVWLAKIEKHL